MLDRSNLFRGKSVKDGKWVYGEVVTQSDDVVYINQVGKLTFCDDGLQSGYFDLVQVNEETLCAFMGFYDRNNNPIYENDIISIYGTLCSKCMDINGVDVDKASGCPFKEKFAGCPQYELMRDVVKRNIRFWLEHETFGYEGECLVGIFERVVDKDNAVRWVVQDCKVIGNVYDNKDINFYINEFKKYD